MTRTAPLRLVCIMLLTLLVSACGSRINSSNFEKIQTDMSVGEVSAILGEPSESTSIDFGPISGTQSTWTDDNGTIAVQFVNGKVKAKQFFKGEGARKPAS